MATNGDMEASRELKVLAQIERDPMISQRTIAKGVGIALGLTNSIVRRLVRKGLVTTRALPANRLAYHLTPKGIADKTRLLIDYVRTTTSFFCILRNAVSLRLGQIQAEQDVRTVAIVGVNELSDAVYLSIRELGLELGGVYDVAKAGTRWLGHDVSAPGEIIDADVVVMLDLYGITPQTWKSARATARIVMLEDILSSDLIRQARGFE
jgi:DNA-binding MarR family transcriptional regulator